MSSPYQSTGGRLIISLIWAMAKNRVIGIENRLPWKLPADLKWFRQNTLGKTVIMGRKTFESFGSKALPERNNIVISSDSGYQPNNVVVCKSLKDALNSCAGESEVMIIGGMSLYKQTLPIANRLYMTVVDTECAGDAWFPDFAQSDWVETSRHSHEIDDKNAYHCDFVILERKSMNDI
jgi:dihydrofolate reductase